MLLIAILLIVIIESKEHLCLINKDVNCKQCDNIIDDICKAYVKKYEITKHNQKWKNSSIINVKTIAEIKCIKNISYVNAKIEYKTKVVHNHYVFDTILIFGTQFNMAMMYEYKDDTYDTYVIKDHKQEYFTGAQYTPYSNIEERDENIKLTREYFTSAQYTPYSNIDKTHKDD